MGHCETFESGGAHASDMLWWHLWKTQQTSHEDIALKSLK